MTQSAKSKKQAGKPAFTMSTFFKNYSEWIVRGVLLAVTCTTLYLNSRYVTLESYEQDKRAEIQDRKAVEELASKRLTALETIIQVMAESNKVNDRQDNTLRDLEIRVRALEINASKSR